MKNNRKMPKKAVSDSDTSIKSGDIVVWTNFTGKKKVERRGKVIARVPAGQDADKLLPFGTVQDHIKYISGISMKNDRLLVAVQAPYWNETITHYYATKETTVRKIQEDEVNDLE